MLLCFALPDEAKFFTPQQCAPQAVAVLVTGVGARNAQRAVQSALGRRRPNLVLTCGFAGGLRPGLSLGSIVYCTDHAPDLAEPLRKLGAVAARFHCAPRIATSAEEKAALWAKTAADAVEMESGVIDQLCSEQQIPCATVRVISDTAEQDLPLDFNALMTEQLELDYGKLARAIACAPQRIPALIQLRRQTRQAALRLGQTLHELIRAHRA
jgi:adenosylhomocysteine nucleosidase